MNRKRLSVWSCAENRSTSRFSGSSQHIHGKLAEREPGGTSVVLWAKEKSNWTLVLVVEKSVCDRLKFLFFVFHLKINASVRKRVVLHRVSTLCSRLPGASSRGFLSVCRQALWRWWFPSPLGLCACSLVWAERGVLQDLKHQMTPGYKTDYVSELPPICLHKEPESLTY